MKKLLPLFFGLFAFAFYVLLYRPPLGSEDFITGLLVFFAALSTSATIILTQEGSRGGYFFYMVVGTVSPLLCVFLMKNANILWHLVSIGFYFIGLLWLSLFVFAYLRRGKVNKEGVRQQAAGNS